MRKMEMRICGCGRFHFYSNELLQNLLEEEKELVLICSRCGNVIHIGADKEPAVWHDENAKEDDFIFNMYSYSQTNETIDAANFDVKKINKESNRTIGKIIIDEGIGVPMETGFCADYRTTEGFYDSSSQFDRMKRYETLEELKKDLDDYDEKRKKVRMNVLLRELTDDQAEVLSSYYIKGLDWSSTKWKKDWH